MIRRWGRVDSEGHITRRLAGGGLAEDATSDVDVDPAPLVDLLAQIRGLRGLRDRGEISTAEYQRRHDRLLERI